MSDERITEAEAVELERLYAAALAGEWHNPTPLQKGSTRSVYQHAPTHPPIEPNRPVCLAMDEPTAAFIAAARAALPKLLSERRELLTQLWDTQADYGELYGIIDEWGEAWTAERREREGKLAALVQCSTCNGQPHVSGLRCVCDGTNSRDTETENLRLAAFDERRKYEKAVADREAAEATLARVRSLAEDFRRPALTRDIDALAWAADQLREALTTPTVVSSDRLTSEERGWVETTRAMVGRIKAPSHTMHAAYLTQLVHILDRLAPPVGHQEDKGNG